MLRGMDLIRRIKIQRPRINAGAGWRLTGAYRFDRGVDASWAVDLRSSGHGLAQAGSGGARSAARPARRRSDGERRRNRNTEPGRTVCYGGCTGTLSTHVRTQQGVSEAAATTRSGARRTAVAAALRRSRASGSEHERPNKRHRWAPYLEVMLRSDTQESGRRRRRGSTRRRDMGRRRRGEPRVWGDG
jgi:hypothetical protein